MPLICNSSNELRSKVLHNIGHHLSLGQKIERTKSEPGLGGQFVPDPAGSRYMESASERRSDRRLDPLFATQLLLEKWNRQDDNRDEPRVRSGTRTTSTSGQWQATGAAECRPVNGEASRPRSRR
jgi:hypothetical protein